MLAFRFESHNLGRGGWSATQQAGENLIVAPRTDHDRPIAEQASQHGLPEICADDFGQGNGEYVALDEASAPEHRVIENPQLGREVYDQPLKQDEEEHH